jgi:hypothetical protein
MFAGRIRHRIGLVTYGAQRIQCPSICLSGAGPNYQSREVSCDLFKDPVYRLLCRRASRRLFAKR